MEQASQNSHSLRDQSTGDRVKALSQQTSALGRKEVDLAKAELTEKGKKAGVGAGMFGAGGLLALFGLAVLTAALMGRERIREATPLAPEQAVETTKEDVQWAKTQIRSETR